ncbi:MAG TPA: type II toxin-antitoxin system RelE/ParE family toxin [Telluria sp.]|jgi:mRNA interferase RelE/StbE
MLKLAITNAADKFLAALQAKQYKQVGSAILGLLRNPEPHDSKQLNGAKNGERRVDVGEYRIVYAVVVDTVEILVIGKRNDDEVYKMWERSR